MNHFDKTLIRLFLFLASLPAAILAGVLSGSWLLFVLILAAGRLAKPDAETMHALRVITTLED